MKSRGIAALNVWTHHRIGCPVGVPAYQGRPGVPEEDDVQRKEEGGEEGQQSRDCRGGQAQDLHVLLWSLQSHYLSSREENHSFNNIPKMSSRKNRETQERAY
ncbi:hypothetical protein CEXT_196601 [Caerostris extrusa]|uniref:Uncharacterized protein n=1 Tax=Caerostris extrusa TaxID=172846 RepID=A0AAV4S6B3_CAEEX|nr:hypothetical protein CEXT_196601 [Caerostris extrusa]